MISGFVVFWQAHVTLGVNCVVEAPVGYRRYGYSGFENIAGVKQGLQRHVAAVTPAPDADALAIHVGKRF